MAKEKKVLLIGVHKFEHVKFTDKKQKTEEVKCLVCGLVGTHVTKSDYVEVKQTRKFNKELIENCKVAEEPQEQKITMSLPVPFTAEEMSGFGKILAEKTYELGKLEAEKKASASSFNGQIETVHAEITDYAKKINKGEEERDIDCIVKFHTPVKDMKTVIRLDTNKPVGEFAMEDQDFNLFTQYNKDENGDESVVENPAEQMELVNKEEDDPEDKG